MSFKNSQRENCSSVFKESDSSESVDFIELPISYQFNRLLINWTNLDNCVSNYETIKSGGFNIHRTKSCVCGFNVLFFPFYRRQQQSAVYLKSWIEAKWVPKIGVCIEICLISHIIKEFVLIKCVRFYHLLEIVAKIYD